MRDFGKLLRKKLKKYGCGELESSEQKRFVIAPAEGNYTDVHMAVLEAMKEFDSPYKSCTMRRNGERIVCNVCYCKDGKC